jgi:hypothetical protein
VRLILTAMVAMLGSLAASAPARAADAPCWEKLVADWSDGTIAGVYPVDCYRQALSHLPEDVRLYSSATNDINRALADRVQDSRSSSMSRSAGVAAGATPAASTAGPVSAAVVLAGSLAFALSLLGGGVWYLTRRRKPRPR